MTDPTDFISSEEPAGSSGRRPRETSLAGAGVRTTAMTAALTLVVAAGVATAAYRSSSSSTQPTALIPANAFAVATADLSLPGGQSGALETMLGRFSGLHLEGAGSIRDRVLRTMLHSADPSIDYDSDVKPWLGDHVAVAGWTHDSQPELEVVLQSTDDASARSHIAQIGNGTAHVVIHDGYAVVGNSQTAVDDAIAASGHASLADSATYGADIGALPDNEAITAWFDGPAAKDLLGGTVMGGTSDALAFSGLGMFGSAAGNLFKSRVALGVHVTDTVAELDVRGVGGTTTQSAPATMLTTLPAGTVGALELGDPGSVVDAVTPLVRFFGSFAAESGTVCFGSSSAGPLVPAVPGLSPQSLRRQLKAAFPPGTPHRRALLRSGLRHYRKALVQAHRRKGGFAPAPMSGCTSEPAPAPTDPFAGIQKMLGISFPDDVKTVLGDRAVVAFGGLELAGLPDIAIRSHPTDVSSAQSLAETLSSHVSGSTPLHIDVSTAGNDLVLATSSTYGQEIAKAGGLGTEEQFGTALDGMPDSVTTAVYVDLSRIWPLLGSGAPTGIQHLHAVGFWAADSGDVQTARLRLVMG
ncbi:MAG TPA: hypothetical protein VH274_02870 [Mycobacteriales bacterium]|nr:hypothetical protein [Mycobacteriales bacterium]